MKRNVLGLVVLALLLAGGACTAFAEEPSIARMVFFEAKPGSKPALEEVIKKHIALRREETNRWRLLTWEYVSGEVPRYCVATFGHPWADFDSPPTNVQVEVAVDAASLLTPEPPLVQYFEHLEEVSDFGTQTNTPALVEISIFQLHYGKTSQFYAALREFHEALSQGDSVDRHEWFELRTGGDVPQFLLMLPRANWNAVDIGGDLLQKRLEDTLGKGRAARVFEQFTSSVKSHQRTMARLRPDLSLLPNPKAPVP